MSTYFTLKEHEAARPDCPRPGPPCSPRAPLFQNQRGYDPDNQVRDDPPDNASSGCDPYHNKWWPFPAGNLPRASTPSRSRRPSPTRTANDQHEHQRREHVRASLPTAAARRRSTATGGWRSTTTCGPAVPNQLFYLAQVDKQTGLNKTMLLDIFDPGDVAGEATLQILSPSGGSQIGRHVQLHDGQQLPKQTSATPAQVPGRHVSSTPPTTGTRASTTRGSTSASR